MVTESSCNTPWCWNTPGNANSLLICVCYAGTCTATYFVANWRHFTHHVAPPVALEHARQQDWQTKYLKSIGK